jgi:type IV pilus assembly protein PilW
MRPHPTLNRGFSMVELMVAMLIGLLGMIIIFQVFEVSEGIKRTTTSGGDAQQNGAVALYVVEHDLRNAGMGFNDAAYAGCNILAFDSKRTTPNFTLSLAPALICAPGSTAPGGMCPGTGTAGTTPDQLTVFYGSQPLIGGSTLITAPVAGPGTAIVSVKNAYGYAPGDLIVLLEPASGKNCSLMEATQVGDAGASNAVYHVAGATYSGQTARFNRAGGLGVGYAVDSINNNANTTRVYNLGNLYQPASGPNVPVHNTYAIDAGNNLTVTSAFLIDDATGRAPRLSAAADNIVHLRAVYGLDDGVNDGNVTFGGTFVKGDGLVDRWVTAATFNALPLVPTSPWQSLVAVRLAIVARSALAEKPSGSDGTQCDATTDGSESSTPPPPDRRPRWSDVAPPGGPGVLIDVSASGDPDPTSPAYWKCYRYRVFETTVPLRNWIWKSS